MGLKDRYDAFRQSRANDILQKTIRSLQFVAAAIGLGLFIIRMVDLASSGISALGGSAWAVVVILAAAVVYTFAMLLLGCCLKGKSKYVRLAMMAMDLAFVGAFIAVAYLTAPGRSSGSCSGDDDDDDDDDNGNATCSLPWGTFINAIASTILHSISAFITEAPGPRNMRPGRKQSNPDDSSDLEGPGEAAQDAWDNRP